MTTQDTTVQPEILAGRYAITRMLGRGAMGVVFEGHDLQLGRIVAIKALSNDLCSNEEAIRVFEEEGRVMAQLNHPNVLAVYDVVRQETRAYLVMEFINGIDIDRAVETSGPLSIDDGVDVAAQLLVALAYLHSQDVVHRDVKPSNMMISREGDLKLMDFGLARGLSVMLQKGTAIRGTPAYMSPEQVLGEPLSHRSDLYCAGASLFEIFTGRLPFTEGELAFHQVFSEVPKPSTFREDLPKAIEDMILRCMEKKPEDRPANPEEVLRTLVKELGQRDRAWPPSVRAFLGGAAYDEDTAWERMDLSSVIDLPKQTSPQPILPSLLNAPNPPLEDINHPTPPPPPSLPKKTPSKIIPIALGFAVVLLLGIFMFALIPMSSDVAQTPPVVTASVNTKQVSPEERKAVIPEDTKPAAQTDPMPINPEDIPPKEAGSQTNHSPSAVTITELEPTPPSAENPKAPEPNEPESSKTPAAKTPSKPTATKTTKTTKTTPVPARVTKKPVKKTPAKAVSSKQDPKNPTPIVPNTIAAKQDPSPAAVKKEPSTTTQPPTTKTPPKTQTSAVKTAKTSDDPSKKKDPPKAKPEPKKTTPAVKPPPKKTEPVVPYGF